MRVLTIPILHLWIFLLATSCATPQSTGMRNTSLFSNSPVMVSEKLNIGPPLKATKVRGLEFLDRQSSDTYAIETAGTGMTPLARVLCPDCQSGSRTIFVMQGLKPVPPEFGQIGPCTYKATFFALWGLTNSDEFTCPAAILTLEK